MIRLTAEDLLERVRREIHERKQTAQGAYEESRRLEHTRIALSSVTRSEAAGRRRRSGARAGSEPCKAATARGGARTSPPAAIHYYRGGLHDWLSLGLPTELGSPFA